MTEVLFYHLQYQTLDHVLPLLLEKSMQREWACLVRCGSEESQEHLNNYLWQYSETGFLPHGTEADGDPEFQPILLTTKAEALNDADVCFVVDGAEPFDIGRFERVVYMFDGRNEEKVQEARVQWKSIKQTEHEATYWQQDASGRWEKKA